jgi:hypothetical protein
MREGELVFLGPTPGFRQRLETAEFERSVTEGRGNRIYWNGRQARHQATHLPGEVVS